MKEEVLKDMMSFIDKPEKWIKTLEQELNQYINQSTNPHKKYAKVAFDKAFDNFKKSNSGALADLMVQQSFSEFAMLKYEFLRGDVTLDYVLMGMDPVDASLCLLEYANKMTDQEYWQKLSETYVSKEFVNIPTDIIHKLFTYPKDHRESMMDEAEYKVYKKLTEVVEVHRAMSKKEYDSGSYRISWTLNKEVAENFVERQKMYFGVSDSMVKTIEVSRDKIIAFLNGRKEEEVIILF